MQIYSEPAVMTRTTMSGAQWYSADGAHWYASPEAARLAARLEREARELIRQREEE